MLMVPILVSDEARHDLEMPRWKKRYVDAFIPLKARHVCARAAQFAPKSVEK